MAAKKKEKDNISPMAQGSEPKQKKNRGILFGVLALLSAMAVMAVVVGGAFYIIIKNNVKGLAEEYRNDIKRIPILSLALPPEPEEYDPLAPKNLSEEELLDNYNVFRKEREELSKELEKTNKRVKELEGYKSESEGLKAENERIKAESEAEKEKLEEEKKKIDELVAYGDKEGFKEFFASVNKDTAEKIYQEILREKIAEEGAKSFAQIYEKMDPAAAAKIFEELGTQKIDLVVNALKNMKKEVAAEILASMDESFAAKVSDKLSKEFGIKL
jgi:flagellar motility protein MotE (MotC chaperone)